MTDEILKSFAQNGPWAVAAAYLMVYILRAWNKDREEVLTLVRGLDATMRHVAESLEKMNARIDDREKDR
jgi:hypothetical protein